MQWRLEFEFKEQFFLIPTSKLVMLRLELLWSMEKESVFKQKAFSEPLGEKPILTTYFCMLYRPYHLGSPVLPTLRALA